MCGIVAASANRNIADDLLNMLRKLDYRGYDSAGVALANNAKRFSVYKKQGNLDQLIAHIDAAKTDLALTGFSGIGHTRWATHGAPIDLNAHPHLSATGRVAIVHNGIIENYRELYAELEALGSSPISETDSEAIALLIENYIIRNPQYHSRNIVSHLIKKLKGAYAIAIQIIDRPREIIGLRYQCPLNFVHVAGFSAIASDLSSLIEYSEKVSVLRDGQAVILSPESAEVFDFDGTNSHAVSVLVDWSVERASRNGHPHFLRKEISEEPQAIHALIKSVRSTENELRQYIKARHFDRVIFLACGSASFSGTFASALTRHWQLPIDAFAEIGSEFRYKPLRMDDKVLLIAVSQSGETADTLGALEIARKYSLGTVSFVNVVGSTLDRQSDISVRLGAGPEIAVPSTKAVINQFLATALIVALLRENSEESIAHWQSGSEKVAEAIEHIITREAEWRDVAEKISGHQSCFALGRGLDYATALEMALKLKETAYIHGEAMYAGEFKHGSISLIEHGMPVFCFISDSSVKGKTISNIEEVKARGAQPFVFDSARNSSGQIRNLGHYFELPDIGEPWSTISQLAIAHILTYHAGLIRDVNVDRPRNLAKSVTVE